MRPFCVRAAAGILFREAVVAADGKTAARSKVAEKPGTLRPGKDRGKRPTPAKVDVYG